MDWEMISVLLGFTTVLGGILIAAAKSIFASKTECEKMYEKIEMEITLLASKADFEKMNKKIEHEISSLTFKLYEKGVPVYVLRSEWNESKDKRALQSQQMQQHLFDKIDKLTEVIEKLRDGQDETRVAISQLQVRRAED